MIARSMSTVDRLTWNDSEVYHHDSWPLAPHLVVHSDSMERDSW